MPFINPVNISPSGAHTFIYLQFNYSRLTIQFVSRLQLIPTYEAFSIMALNRIYLWSNGLARALARSLLRTYPL